MRRFLLMIVVILAIGCGSNDEKLPDESGYPMMKKTSGYFNYLLYTQADYHANAEKSWPLMLFLVTKRAGRDALVICHAKVNAPRLNGRPEKRCQIFSLFEAHPAITT